MCARCRWACVSCDGHVEFRGGYRATFDALEGQHGAGFERGDRVYDRSGGGLIRAGIRQRAHQHVAADPGEGVQIAEQGHGPFIMDDSKPRVRETLGRTPLGYNNH